MGLDNPSHIAILVVILLLVFGARRLPEIGRSLGSGLREFKGAITGEPEKPAAGSSPEPPPVSEAPQHAPIPAQGSSVQSASADSPAPTQADPADRHASTPTA
jgi:TatA/E family protein of Tat protein translocase